MLGKVAQGGRTKSRDRTHTKAFTNQLLVFSVIYMWLVVSKTCIHALWKAYSSLITVGGFLMYFLNTFELKSAL